MKKIVLTLNLVFSLMFVSAQQLSFSEALGRLERGNQKLKGIEKQALATKIGQRASKGLQYPEFTLNGSFVHMNDNLYLNFNKYKLGFSALSGIPPNVLGDWRFQFQEQNITRLSADMKWPIFTGGKIKAGLKAGELKAEIAEVEVNKTKNILISELAERYFQTQLAREAVKVREQALEAFNKHLYDAQKLQENGMIAEVQTMQAQSVVSEAERDLAAAKKDAELAEVALVGVMGEQNKNYDLSSPLFEVKGLQELSYYQNLAKENYPEIIQAGLKKQLAEQDVALKKGQLIPDVAIVGKKYLVTENLPITEPQWYVGVGLKLTLFDGLQNKYNLEKAKAVSESVDYLKAQAEIDIQTLVKKYYTEIEKQKEQIINLDKSIAFSEEVLRVREKAFKEGFSTSTEVSDAQLYLASMKVKRLQALYEMDKALALLLQTCGISHQITDYTL